MKIRKQLLLWTAAALALPILGLAVFYLVLRITHPNAGAANIRISQETTFVTGPIGEDGYIDFLAALNNKASEGVTPENNAAVLFWEVMGPQEIPEEYRRDFFAMLGVKPLPEEGDYLIELFQFAEDHSDLLPDIPDEIARDIERTVKETEADPLHIEEAAVLLHAKLLKDQQFDLLNEQIELAQVQPWSAEEYPLLAAWLAANETQLDHFVKATRRTRYYSPEYSDTPFIFEGLIPELDSIREPPRALLTRAMLRLGEGNTAACQDDLLACLRWGRLLHQNERLLHRVTAYTIERQSYRAIVSGAHFGAWNQSESESFMSAMNELGPHANLAETFDFAERLTLIDMTIKAARFGFSAMDGSTKVDKNDLSYWWNEITVDWNQVLSVGNQWQDRYVLAAEIEDAAQQIAEIDRISAEMEELRVEFQEQDFRGNSLSGPRSQQTATVFFYIFAPAMSTVVRVHNDAAMRLELTKTALELAAYRHNSRTYPAALDYMSDPTKDIYTGEPVLYRREGEGYILYSVGPDGVDDGGIAEEESDSENYDVVVRVPHQDSSSP